MKPLMLPGGRGSEERSFAALLFRVFGLLVFARTIPNGRIVGRKISALMAAVLLGGMVYDASAQVQLVQNGGFEFFDAQGMTVGWTVSGETNVSDFGFSQLLGVAHSG